MRKQALHHVLLPQFPGCGWIWDLVPLCMDHHVWKWCCAIWGCASSHPVSWKWLNWEKKIRLGIECRLHDFKTCRAQEKKLPFLQCLPAFPLLTWKRNALGSCCPFPSPTNQQLLQLTAEGRHYRCALDWAHTVLAPAALHNEITLQLIISHYFKTKVCLPALICAHKAILTNEKTQLRRMNHLPRAMKVSKKTIGTSMASRVWLCFITAVCPYSST